MIGACWVFQCMLKATQTHSTCRDEVHLEQHLLRKTTFDNSTPTPCSKNSPDLGITNDLFWIQNLDFCRMVTSFHPCSIEVNVLLMAYRRRRKQEQNVSSLLQNAHLFILSLKRTVWINLVHKMFMYACFSMSQNAFCSHSADVIHSVREISQVTLDAL